ncbi:hypothetical protein DFH27DRAFT_107846 [Peziza echinospora]|nr:hypothetical protein DFH27DRAFT_107846 [Peziza echinospora]
MASSMKKLKTLHQITTSPSPQYSHEQYHHQHSQHTHHHQQQTEQQHQPHPAYHHKLPTTPPSSSSSPTDKPKRHHRSRIPVPTYYQHPTPPVSPTGSSVSTSTPPSPQQHQRRNSATSSPQQASRQESTKKYAEMLRSARQALHQLQHHHVPVQQAVHQQQRSLHPILPEVSHQQQKRHPILPAGGFIVLTSEDHQPQQQQQQQQQRTLLPPIQLNAPSQAPPAPSRSSKRKPLQLTKALVQDILQDTRMARWQRVQGYVREQRKLILKEQAEERRNGTRKASLVIPGQENPLEGEGYPWAQYVYGWTDEGGQRAILVGEPYAEMDRKNGLLEELDRLEEIQARSLWSGGSAGTNGVDEFVWDDDEEGFAGDADMLDIGDWGNRERQKMKREYQQKQEHMWQQIHQQHAVDERFMREEEASKAVDDHRRRYHRSAAGATPPRTPTSPQSHHAQVQATPPQLKPYTASFYKSKNHIHSAASQQRSPRQEYYHPRPGTAGSGAGSPGYKRQSIGRGIQSGKAGSFGSVDGAVFRMDGEEAAAAHHHHQQQQMMMDVDSAPSSLPQNLPLPSSYFMKNSPPRTSSPGAQVPSYTAPTFSSLGKTRGSNGNKSPQQQYAAAASPLDKGLREYMEALRRYEVRCAADVYGENNDDRRRRRSAMASQAYFH